MLTVVLWSVEGGNTHRDTFIHADKHAHILCTVPGYGHKYTL